MMAFCRHVLSPCRHRAGMCLSETLSKWIAKVPETTVDCIKIRLPTRLYDNLVEWFVNDFKHKIIDVVLARNTLCNENFLQYLENYYKFIVFNYPYYRINYKNIQDNTDPTYSQIDKRAVEHQIPALWRQQCAIQKHAYRQQAAFCVCIKLLSNGTIGDGGTVAALLRQPVTAHGRQYCGSQ